MISGPVLINVYVSYDKTRSHFYSGCMLVSFSKCLTVVLFTLIVEQFLSLGNFTYTDAQLCEAL